MDVKETREAFVAVNELALYLVERLKDGIGLDDLTSVIAKLASDEEFKTKMADGFNGIKLIPEEIKDLDISEGMLLATDAIGYVPKYIEAFKK